MGKKSSLLSVPDIHQSTFQLPVTPSTSYLLDSTVGQLFSSAGRVVPLACNDTSSGGHRMASSDERTARFSRRFLTWQSLSVAALLINICSAVFMAAAYASGRWQVSIYLSTNVLYCNKN